MWRAAAPVGEAAGERFGAGSRAAGRGAPFAPLLSVSLALAGVPLAALEGVRGVAGGWRERANTLLAFAAFADAEGRSGGPIGDRSWPARLARAGELPDDESLWVTEGLGYRWGESRLVAGGAEGGLPADLPQRARIPIHTGIGLAFATRAVAEAAAGDLPGAVSRFLGRCRGHSLPGYEAAALEALGLPARVLRPRLVRALDAEVARRDADLLGPFWHGVGRALYFIPSEALAPPSRAGGGLVRALHEAPHAAARNNLVAGYAWAVALVNVRSPEAVVGRLQGLRSRLSGGPAEQGAAAALEVWRRWTGEEPPAGWRALGLSPAAGEVADLFRYAERRREVR